MGGAAGWEKVPKADALEFTPTWIVAGVCSLIVFISLAAERCLHYRFRSDQTSHCSSQSEPPPNHPNPRSPIPVPAKPRLPNQLDELIEKEKFLCCRLKHYISCIFSSLFWLSPMWF